MHLIFLITSKINHKFQILTSLEILQGCEATFITKIHFKQKAMYNGF